LRFPLLAAGSKNNLSTMRAKKRTRCATGRHRQSCRCLRGTAPAFAPRRASDRRGAIGVGARYPRKPLMSRVKQEGAKGVAKNNA
jgi:hypothetical protein